MIEVKQAGERLLKSRIRLLSDHGFFGLLLMHMEFILEPACETAATDGKNIYFGPDFLGNLSDLELDFIMMHEVLHAALMHHARGRQYDHAIFNIACDIVVNSTIMHELGRKKPIVLKEYGTAMWLAPNGSPGYRYSAEDVYDQLMAKIKKQKAQQGAKADASDGSSKGKISGGQESGNGGGDFRDDQLMSTIKEQKAQQSANADASDGSSKGKLSEVQKYGNGGGDFHDDHSLWDEVYKSAIERAKWEKRILDAVSASASRACGKVPLFAKRLRQEMISSQLDWRTMLNDFIQEEIHDYTFMPPDRRQLDGDFFLPDFNDKEELLKDIMFYIDTSGSITPKEMNTAFSEIAGAIEQFGGRLSGILSYFDAIVSNPKAFESVRELKKISLHGGGGTSFQAVFEHLENYPFENLPTCCIILTDGCAPYPPEHSAKGIPVLWIINNEKITPPWGRVARIK